MIINLNDRWRIRSDPLQWILERRPSREQTLKGRSKDWVPLGYFNTVAGALREAAQRQVRELEGEYPPAALEPLCRQLSSIRESIEAALVDVAEKKRADA